MSPPFPEDAVVPAGPESLSLTVHGTPSPAQDYAAAQTPRGRLTMFVILFACALPVVASYVTYFWLRPSGRTNYSTLIEPQRPLPDAQAVAAHDLDGRAVPLAGLKGQWLLVVVGPASCAGESACERRLFLQRQLREMAGAERGRIDKVWLVDTPGPVSALLRATLQAPPAVRILRVDREALSHWLVPAPGHALEDHLYIVDPLGNWMMRSPPDPDPLKLKKDLDRLLRGSEWWDRARGDASGGAASVAAGRTVP